MGTLGSIGEPYLLLPPLSQVRYIDNLKLVFLTMDRQSPAHIFVSPPKQCKPFWQQLHSCQPHGMTVSCMDKPLLAWSSLWRIRL